jgi:hypothetical protein
MNDPNYILTENDEEGSVDVGIDNQIPDQLYTERNIFRLDTNRDLVENDEDDYVH